MPTCAITTALLTSFLEDLLAESPYAVAMEDGETLFDFQNAKYAVSGEGKCVLHLWSEERNIVRRVLDAERTSRALRLSVIRFGQSHPNVLEICADREHRSAAAQKSIRLRYQRLLERVLLRDFPGCRLEHVSSKADLEHSMSSVYTRAVLRSGQSAFAILGVNNTELQPSIDAALTFGILWMDYQRQQLAGRAHVEGLTLFAPSGKSSILRQRMAYLDVSTAKWQLYELDELSEICESVDATDIGNIGTRLVRAVDVGAAEERFAKSIARIRELAPATQIKVESPSEVAFRLHGLEFARARMTPERGSFRHSESIVFGLSPAEYVLDDESEQLFREIVQRILEHRHCAGSYTDILFRSCPERWLETLITENASALDERLDGSFVYSQVPAFAASDRAMIDVLTCSSDGRLAVLELKADDDIHLPLQGLDYWARVRWHQERGEFTKFGYFPGRELSPAAPRLFLVTPVLRTHPATDVLLRYLSPQIEWTVLQIGEQWRSRVRVVSRKRRR